MAARAMIVLSVRDPREANRMLDNTRGRHPLTVLIAADFGWFNAPYTPNAGFHP